MDSPDKSKDEALAAKLDTMEHVMRRLETMPDGPRKRLLTREFQISLKNAERIKDGLTSRWDNTKRGIPTPKRTLSTREQIILLKGSKVYGSAFLPWVSPPVPREFELLPGQSMFIDDVELRLSDVQMKIFNGWRRPDDICQPLSLKEPEVRSGMGATVTNQGRVDLVQDVTSDCSVVASLCAITARVEPGHSNIISSIFYPFNHQSHEPLNSSNGKYVLRLNFNGCFRKVIIDDRLPSSSTSQSLHVVDRNNPGLLWPAIIEKAYLKIRGGYDFPGSNSGTDLWVLTSWIPEQLFLQRDESSPDALWHRVFTAFKCGDVFITIGTGRINEREEEAMGLIGEHDYAIIDMQETESKQRFLVKNPWSEGTTWKGGLNQRDDKGDFPGTFWMDLNDVFQSFESMYLNWNPCLFSFREDIHFTWDITVSRNPVGSFGSSPQFGIQSTVGGSVWLLLSRHFKNVRPSRGDDARKSLTESRTDHGFISLYAFDKNGERVFVSDGAKLRGTYVDSPNNLLKLEIPPGKAYTIVVSEQGLQSLDYSFTLSAFSLHSLTMKEARNKYKHYTLREAAWTSSSSGGNANSDLYHTNPQFSFHLSAASDICLLLESVESFPVHVKLIWANGKTVYTVTNRDIIADSGEYRKGYAFAEVKDVQAGTYTIVCSTFETGQLGKFTLRIGTMSACIVERVRSVGAGRLVLNMPALFAPGVNRLLAPITCQRPTRVSVVARCRSNKLASIRNTAFHLKLAVEHGQGPKKQVLAVNGEDEFRHIRSVPHTNDIDILPSMCDAPGLWVVVQRLGGSEKKEAVEIQIVSEGPINLGTWGTGDG